MTNILGISAFYHDAAAALLVDGRVVAAAQEERFSRRKHDAEFPHQAIDYCLHHAGIEPQELDYVGFYDKPLRKFERLIENYLAFVPSGYGSFRQALPVWLKQKLHVPREIRRGLPGYSKRIVFPEHHQSHAASAFYPSPFEEAAILTVDGVGEWTTTCIGHGQGHQLQLHQEIRYPHSLGLLYSAFTFYSGFRVNSGEYKLMGLAPYGQPVYRDLILEKLIDLKPDGSLHMDMSYFNYCQGLTMTSSKFHKLFGAQPRSPESPIAQRDKDLAASIQAVTEEAMLRMASHAQSLTGSKHLVLAGGVALNCVANGRIQREGPFDKLWIQPAAGDAGAALGTALFIWHQLLDRPRAVDEGAVDGRTNQRQPSELPGRDSQAGSRLGPEYSDIEIRQALDSAGAVATQCADDHELCDRVARLIDQQQVVGWFQGRMEFGPRALGGRSILGDARSPTMQSVINQKIKFRESFRPFAPMVLAQLASEYFEWPSGIESPYMMLVARVRDGVSLPAVTHVDRSARVQTVDDWRQPLLHQLLSRFHDLTGCAAMINTSFNVRSEPIVCSPQEAYRCFMMTDMDALAIGRHVLLKSQQPKSGAGQGAGRDEYLKRFELD